MWCNQNIHVAVQGGFFATLDFGMMPTISCLCPWLVVRAMQLHSNGISRIKEETMMLALAIVASFW